MSTNNIVYYSIAHENKTITENIWDSKLKRQDEKLDDKISTTYKARPMYT